jgi:DNA-directed RNA polymerase subunit E"
MDKRRCGEDPRWQGREISLGDKACKNCRMISAGPVCPNCKSTNLSDDWTGVVIVINPDNSEIAKKMTIKTPGKYAIRVR